MTDGLNDVSIADQAQHDLGSLLAAVEPSPALAVSVRTRIAQQRVRSAHPTVLALATAFAICVSAGTWAVVSRRSDRPSDVSRAIGAPTSEALRPAVIESKVAPVATTAASQLTALVQRASQTIPEGAPVRSGDGRVLVPDDQRVALIHLLQGIRAGRETVPQRLLPIYDKDGLIVPPTPVVVSPLLALAPPDPIDLDGGSLAPNSRKDER